MSEACSVSNTVCNCEKMDMKIKSITLGRCLKCGAELDCPSGCYSAASYGNNTESSIALEQGVCMECGGKVNCQNECL